MRIGGRIGSGWLVLEDRRSSHAMIIAIRVLAFATKPSQLVRVCISIGI